jgi:phosphoenolpyruvate synthase/pyruvate phosphate dikinase
MEATARRLEKASRIFTPDAFRRKGSLEDLIEDLKSYWNAYSLHMTSLFTFWNAEFILSTTLTECLKKLGAHEEIKNGLARFFKPYEENYFVTERKSLQKIASRFDIKSQDHISEASREALQVHADLFGFLLAPFNLGSPPAISHVRERIDELKNFNENQVKFEIDTFKDFPTDIQILGLIAQRLTFWKTERIDIMSLADFRAWSLFEEAIDILRITPAQLFAMTQEEVISSLGRKKLSVSMDTVKERLDGFCLALIDGEIKFYQSRQEVAPDDAELLLGKTILKGVGASPGIATGVGKIINSPQDIKKIG